MAAQKKLFQRLIWLVDTIYSAGKITRDEIDRRWANSAYNDDHDTEYGEYAYLDEALFDLLQYDANRQVLSRVLIETYLL